MSPAEYIKYLADNHIKIELPEDNRKYPGQQCQDDKLNEAFRRLHTKLVNYIILFCKDWHISIDEFHLNADGLAESISYGSWQSCTDSSLIFKKFNDEYKHAFWDMSIKDPKELDRIERENHEPFLLSM